MFAKRPFASLLLVVAAALLPWALSSSARAAAAGAAEPGAIEPVSAITPATAIAQVTVGRTGAVTSVRVESNGRLTYQAARLEHPERLVLDFSGVHLMRSQSSTPSNAGPVQRVRLGQYQSDVARLVIELDHAAPYYVRAEAKAVVIEFAEATPAAGAPITKKPDPKKTEPKKAIEADEEPETVLQAYYYAPSKPAAEPQAAESAAATTPATAIAQMTVGRTGAVTSVRVEGNGRLTYQASHLEHPERVVLNFSGVHLLRTETSGPSKAGPVRRVRLGQYQSNVARLVIELDRAAPYRVWAEGKAVVVEFAEDSQAVITREAIEAAGQAEIAFQGYYLAGSGQPLSDTTGAAVKFNEFLPRIGLLKGNLAGYGFQGGFKGGENFLEMEGMSFLGHHWDFLGGDFRMPANLVDNPFYNVYNPELRARGFDMAIRRTNRTIRFFFGRETLQEGPRVPFFIQAPQTMFGASVEQQIGERLKLGFRFLHLASSDAEIGAKPFFFPPNRQFPTSDTLSFQSSYKFSEHVKFYGEASLAHAVRKEDTGAGRAPLSFFLGPAWETQKFALRANYAYQGVSYLPLVGNYAGDRKGPFLEGHYRITPKIDLYGSASHYSNNLEGDTRIPTFASTGYSTGASFILPWKFSASGQVSLFSFNSNATDTSPAQASNNRQIQLDLSRPVGRHSLRFAFMDLNTAANFGDQHQQSLEFDDNFVWRRIVLGGGIRLQRQITPQPKNTLFFRGSASASLGRFSAYGNFEKGTDFVSQTVFAKNAISSTVVGLSTPIGKAWTLQLEAFRNNLTTSLNPASIFVLGQQGVGLPTFLSAFNQWSAYFRFSRQLHWGAPIPANAEGLEGYARAHVPLVGTVEGFVMEISLAGTRPAEGVPVSLDDNKVVQTDAQGSYRFTDVTEGFHQVGLAQRELPAEFEPGPTAGAKVQVEPRHTARSDFQVVRLTALTGRVSVPEDASPEGIIIRLLPAGRYTTPDADGNFAFYNLREGDYEVVLDAQTLPDMTYLDSPARAPVAVRLGAEPLSVKFEIKARKIEKPIHIIFQQQLNLGGSGGREQQ